MLISKQWLSEFVKLPDAVSDQDLAKTVTLSTVEVERVIDQAAAMQGMVVGLVKTVAAHPNADRLKVCQVDIGERVTQIVCGGTNVAEGMKVAVALPGSRVRWHGEGDLIELGKTKIRGEESEGMICAGVEIGIEKSGEGEHEIMDLGYLDADPSTSSGLSAGTPLAKALGRDDVVFEIEHKSLTNRPDLMGHYGMAREVAALYRVPLAPYAPHAPHAPKTLQSLSVTVADAALCPRYMAVTVEGVTVGPSPAWLRNRLLSCGVRSINNVVDVTNYVMLELGQPMHAFDADKIGPEIVVRSAKKGEKIACLDDETYELGAEMLLVTDGKNPIAIAGVMGGKESAVTNATTRVVFESANFSPVSVRKTSTKLGLRSESSARFEKSLDSENCDPALRRAVALLQELCPVARVASAVVDEYPSEPEPIVLAVAPEEIGARLGADIPAEDMNDILSRLGFDVKGGAKSFSVTVPTWRATKDVSIKEDLIEEVARIWGYDRIASALPTFPINPPPQDPVRLFARRMRRTLSRGLGVTEVYRYAFVGTEILETLGFNANDHLKLANPLAADRPYLVQSLVPNLFETVAGNHRAFPSVSVFEIDRVFFPPKADQPPAGGGSSLAAEGEEDGSPFAEATGDKQGGTLPAQPYHLGVAYSAHGDESPFVELRRQVEAVLSEAGLNVSFRQMAEPIGWMHPTRSADILVDGKKYGILAEATPEVATQLGIDRRVAVAEMNLSMLAFEPSNLRTFAPLPQFPDAKRDLAFVVDDRVAYGDIEKSLHAASPLLVAVELFDVYRGKGVEEGKKSVAVHLVFRSTDRTLSSEEVDGDVVKLVNALESQLGGIIRT